MYTNELYFCDNKIPYFFLIYYIFFSYLYVEQSFVLSLPPMVSRGAILYPLLSFL